MGRPDPERPRLVKVVLPTRAHWRRALANARLLRGAGLSNVFIRRSMTEDERKRESELRQQARERNKGKTLRVWVVYQGHLNYRTDARETSSGARSNCPNLLPAKRP
uniref:Transposase n=1 Tax=Haemonchus contortus TaxID=6289 RepID=A0A7I4Z3K9_HAECO